MYLKRIQSWFQVYLFKIVQRTELRIRDAFFRVNQALHLTLTGWQDPVRSTSFWKLWACGCCEGPQWKLYLYLLAYKCAEQPWEAPCGLTFTGCSLFSYITLLPAPIPSHCHQALRGDEVLLIASRLGGSIKWIQIGWSTCQSTGLLALRT